MKRKRIYNDNHISVSKSDYITGEIPVEKMINDRIPSHKVNEVFFDEEDVFGHTDPNGGWGKQMEMD